MDISSIQITNKPKGQGKFYYIKKKIQNMYSINVEENIPNNENNNDNDNDNDNDKETKFVNKGLQIKKEDQLVKIINRGTGAGGANTNKSGKPFEEKTDLESYLIEKEFEKIYINKKAKEGYYLQGNIDGLDIVFTKQGGLKQYLKEKINLENKNKNKTNKTNKIDFTAFKPDEIYIITRKDNNNSKVIIKVIEKKNQNVAGSTDEKLRTAEFFRKAYKIVFETYGFENVQVDFAFSVNDYIKKELEKAKPLSKYDLIKESYLMKRKQNYFMVIHQIILKMYLLG